MNDKNKLKDSILFFENKIKKQGLYTNERDELHLSSLKELLKELEEKQKYPFEEGETYYTTDKNGLLIKSVWDDISVEIYNKNPNKPLYKKVNK